MYRRFALAIFTLSISVHSYAQEALAPGWTDKNNTERCAAYMIQNAYYEQGYLGAEIQVRKAGPKRIFEVDPGRRYHIKSVEVLGESVPLEVMNGAPTAGDVYSAARMNEWMTTLRNRYKKDATWGARYDRVEAAVTIEVDLDAHSAPNPK